MRYVLSPDQMRAMEAEYMAASGVSSLELMERAAEGVVALLKAQFGDVRGKRAVFACGPGMNGGDGYAAARLFAAAGGQAIVLPLHPVEKLVGDARTNARAAQGMPAVYFTQIDRLDSMPRPDIWVDALFGIGLARDLEQDYRTVLLRMEKDRAAGALIVAVDIPTGLGAQGQILGAAVRADHTVTFGYPKLSHVLGHGPERTGILAMQSIGLTNAPPPDAARIVEREDLLPLFAPRRRETHKNSYGHLLIIAGSRGMAGAALLATRAALRSGVGLVTIACPDSIVPILQSGVPCAMCIPLPEKNGAIADDALPILKEAIVGKSALAVGPGLSRRASGAVVQGALECGLPAVFDADALNLIAESDARKAALQEHHIITPHPGEAARLLQAPCEDPVAAARALRAMGPVALVKGATTLICAEALTISLSGSPGMAKGGSGDVLTGVIGALLARGIEPERAAWAASELHGLAGERAAQALGETAMTAADIAAQLPDIYRALEAEAKQ